MKYNELLQHINPATLAYDEWLAVGMAIKHEGGTCSEWDEWSKQDARYRDQDCFGRWEGFSGSETPVTAGTLVALAKAQGWTPGPREGRAYDWDDVVYNPAEDGVVIDLEFLEDADITAPADNWDGVSDFRRYLEALFQLEEYVGFVCDSYESDGRMVPGKGCYSMTAGEILRGLAKCKGDIGKVLGDYNPSVGAWIRFNPLDGQGIKDANVTAFRYALVESDNLPIERQAAVYDALELPCAALVHSGNKSLHAIVRIDAANMDEYKSRVRYLHEVCKKNGLSIDTANKNPSRLSRMPGVRRDGNKQYLVAVNTGKASWDEWKAWIEELNDNLPDFQALPAWADIPDKPPALIDGLLRAGHKMLVAGPSKAGKSFLLLELAIAIAEGREWLGMPVQQGRVLYVNLELDPISALHRIRDLYQALQWAPAHADALQLWQLRGKAMPLDALAPRLIRRAQKGGYTAIIIDPLYKILTGDENSAHEMALFCNQFDRICADLGCATIYCHHHSKGLQAEKASMDRASGSGVFARDPDALIDLIELPMDSAAVQAAADKFSSLNIPPCPTMSAWRLESTLREFPPFAERLRCIFNYPIHIVDKWGVTDTLVARGEQGKTPEQKTFETAIIEAHKIISQGDVIPTADKIAETIGRTVEQIKNAVDKMKGYGRLYRYENCIVDIKQAEYIRVQNAMSENDFARKIGVVQSTFKNHLKGAN
jgi:regulatory protein RepA